MFALRYDMRRPHWSPASSAELYGAALDQAAYADEHELGTLTVSEHHGAVDGYLPSPLMLAAAFAGRTSKAHISISAVLAPLHDPVQLAEDIAVLDLISGGRLSLVIGLGYRPSEYEMFGQSWSDRGRRLDEVLDVLIRCWTGEAFEWQGRAIQVTPRPVQEPHPFVLVGGSSAAAARRAARFGLGFFPTSDDPALRQAYRSECEALGKPPGFVGQPEGPSFVHVAEDPDRAWAEIGPHLLHDAQTYASWQPPGQRTHVTRDERIATVEDLRAAGSYRIVTPWECVDLLRDFGSVILHPLIGGLPPGLSWPSLELIVNKVLPALAPAV